MLKGCLFSPVLWGNVLAMLLVAAGLVFGVREWLDRYTLHGQEIEVPTVTGKSPATAGALLYHSGLRAEVADSSYDRALPPGTVLAQRPAGGSHVKEGRTIFLTVNSTMAPTMALPDVAGNCSRREAEERLVQLGFKLGEPHYVDGDEGWVYGLLSGGREVFNGQRLTVGSTVSLMVGGRPEVEEDVSTGEDWLW